MWPSNEHRTGYAMAMVGMLMACASPGPPVGEKAAPGGPNFLVIVADDLGFSDIGFMGSEIRTPNLDALAAGGLVLTNFHVSATCSPTRAMLLTGVDAHPAGLGTMRGQAAPEQEGQPGYAGVLSRRVVTVATLLREAGYHTYLAGKWHLGDAEGMLPTDRGFERSFGPTAGGASHFSDQLSLFYPGRPPTRARFVEDGQDVAQLPEDYFSTDFFTSKLIEQIESGRDDGRPFLAFATYTAPHWPLQAPEDYIDRYAGVYDEGYDVLRERRVAALRARGIVPADTQTPGRLPWVAPWTRLGDEQRLIAARRMELLAAMVENLDHNIGRLVDYLRRTGQYRNTVILFFSDNGAEGNPVNRIVDDPEWVEREFDNRLQNMGRRHSYVFTGPGWAQASTAPFRYFKAFPAEGGIRTPAIVAGGGATLREGFDGAFVSVKDVAPTLLDLAGVAHPGEVYRGRGIAPLEGASMAPFLAGRAATVHDADHVMGWELFGRRALRRGDWKIVWLSPPYGQSRWQLFDLANDPAETTDLSDRNPQKLAELVAHWDAYAERNGVVLPATDSGYANEDPW